MRESVEVPRDCSVSVPVRLTYANLNTPQFDWLAEPTQVKPGLLAARTLLPNDDTYASILLLNVSGVNQIVSCGHSLGNATPCVSNTTNNSVASDVDPSTQTLVKCATIDTMTDAGQRGGMAGDSSHVLPIVDRLPDNLSNEQREIAIGLIKRNADVFSRHEFDVGCTNLVTAEINTGDALPFAEPLRRHPWVYLDTIDETIQRMKDSGIVEDANSPWSSNIVVVAKRDDQGRSTTPRITLDFRKLNAITYRDRFPLPNAHDCLRS